MNPSEKSRRAYNRAMNASARLKMVNEELRPLHERALKGQEEVRLAFERMNIAFAEEGLNPAEAFEALQAEDRAANTKAPD